MSITATMDESGCIALPKRVRTLLHLEGRKQLEVQLTSDSITLRPKLPNEPSQPTARLVRKGKLLVATGFRAGADIGAAISAEREERDDSLSAPFAAGKSQRP